MHSSLHLLYLAITTELATIEPCEQEVWFVAADAGVGGGGWVAAALWLAGSSRLPWDVGGDCHSWLLLLLGGLQFLSTHELVQR